MTVYTTTDSPLGELLLVAEEGSGGVSLTSVTFSGQKTSMAVQDGRRRDAAAFTEITGQLEAYFTGQLQRFDVEYTSNGTPFQERVWAALREIPYGSITTYGKVAEQIGASQDRIRAVGAAIGANPLLIIAPCHRVIGANGSLTGYAGGVERKRSLLTLEGALQPMFS